MQYVPAISLSLILAVSPAAIAADQCAPGAPLALEGATDWKPKERKRRSELSAVVMRGGNLLAISNERTRKRRHVIQVFRPAGANRYVFDHDEELFQAAKAGCRESDFEAAALHDNQFYVISSHSLSHVRNPRAKPRTLASCDGFCPARDTNFVRTDTNSCAFLSLQTANWAKKILEQVCAPF